MLYAAKCYWPGVTEDEVKSSVGGMAGAEADASYLGSLVFEGDDLVLCLFDAGSAAAARDASERAGLPCERVMGAAWLGNHTTERSQLCVPPERS